MSGRGRPAIIQAYLEELLVESVHPLTLSFDAHWNLRASDGACAARAAGRGVAAPELAAWVRDLFTGLPADRQQVLPMVELADGCKVHAHLLPDGEGFHVLLLDASDEHARRSTQQQLGNEAALASQAKTRAIRHLREVRDELARQREGLAEADALKTVLIATLGHDFRTPLTSLFGYLYLLEADVDPASDAGRALAAIHRSASYLSTLAENLLEYARSGGEAPPFEPVPVDLAAFAAELEGMLRPLAAGKGLDLHLSVASDGAEPWLDSLRLRQIAVNLLSNAIRYTEAGGVRVNLELAGGSLRLRVSDTGIGIRPEFRDRIFEPFERCGLAGREGTGLGLSIVRRLATQMGGRVWLDAEVTAGASFVVDIPARAPAAARPGGEATAGPDRVDAASVLVVDDDPDIAVLLQVLLEGLGCSVAVVHAAGDAMRRVESDPPDFVLTDVRLPDRSGNALAYQLRARGFAGGIVTLSADRSSEAREAALRAGADCYLVKPLDMAGFPLVLRQALAEAASRRARLQ